MTNDRILVFIPMYNCARQIPRVLARFTPEIQGLFGGALLVNNRSTDSTENEALKAARGLSGLKAVVVRNRENYGLGGSHKVAFDYALANGFTHVVTLHGDDQGSIEDLIPHLRRGRHREADCLLGARFLGGSSLEGYSWFRTFGNRVYNGLFSAVCGRRIYDLGSGLNLYSVRILEDGFYRKFPDDLTFNYCMVMAHSFYGHKAEFFPITWREDDQVSNVKLFSQSIKVLRMLAAFTLDKGGFLRRDLRAGPDRKYLADEVF